MLCLKVKMNPELYGKAPYIVGGIVGLAAGAVILKKLLRRRKVYNDPPDTVILCTIPRGPAAPSISPFPLKLETYLRVANIPHKTVFNRGMSSKGKTPFIMLNGEEIADSQFCIEFLNKRFNVDLDKDLSPEQKAAGHAFRRALEEGFYWCFGLERWVYCESFNFLKVAFKGICPSYVLYLFSRGCKKAANVQGTGRHSKEQVRHIGVSDLKAVSDYLGKKPYFMGDKFTEVDSALFGMMSQLKWHSPGSIYEKAVSEDFPNLEAYLLRVREEIWPDWPDCITHGGYRKAIK